jgi:hypothetical protein
MDGKEEEDDLELRLNNHILNTDRRFRDHEGMFRETNGTVAAQRKLIDATKLQVDATQAQVAAQNEGTEVLREVAVLLKDFTHAVRPLIKGLAWIGRAVKFVGLVAGGLYAIWYVVKPVLISVLHWLRIV